MVSEILVNMTAYAGGNRRDINHFLKVYAYARAIGRCEELSPFAQEALEIAAIVHDIACPLCREKYGSTYGPYQEAEGMVLAREFLAAFTLSPELLERIVFLVGHHHSPQLADGPDYQILLEADYLVNAEEHGYPEEQISAALKSLFRTATGSALLRSVYFPA